MQEEKGEGKLSYPRRNHKWGLLAIFVFLAILAVVVFHPWINQEAVNEVVQKQYHLSYLRVVLTEWSPLGSSFEAQYNFSGAWMTVGHGFVDIFGRVLSYDGCAK